MLHFNQYFLFEYKFFIRRNILVWIFVDKINPLGINLFLILRMFSSKNENSLANGFSCKMHKQKKLQQVNDNISLRFYKNDKGLSAIFFHPKQYIN